MNSRSDAPGVAPYATKRNAALITRFLYLTPVRPGQAVTWGLVQDVCKCSAPDARAVLVGLTRLGWAIEHRQATIPETHIHFLQTSFWGNVIFGSHSDLRGQHAPAAIGDMYRSLAHRLEWLASGSQP